MQIDPTKSAVQNLLALIDASNPSAPNLPAEITASAPIAGTYPNGGDTKVTLTGTGPYGTTANFNGSVDVTYKRLSLAAEAANPAGPVPVSRGDSDAGLLSKVATYFGFIPGEIAFAASPTRPAISSTSSSATIQASGSLIYEDGTTSVNLSWPAVATTMLLHFDGANGATATTDSSDYARPITLTGSLTTSREKFGTAALGAGAYLTVPDAPELRATGDFTIEGWFYITDTNANQALFGKAPSGVAPYAHLAINAGGWYFYADTSGTVIQVPIPSGSVNAWNHIALVRSNGVWTFYQNGVSIGTGGSGDTFGNNAGPFIVGNWAGGNVPFTGNIDEFRVSKMARYTANFTPPTAPFVLD